ncbi:hypothetical protein HZY86_07865 [Aerococcaceae bacterium DSM 111020]|nr:hypothetical protein [Aerococcaceae bacterium DSM 111020]
MNPIHQEQSKITSIARHLMDIYFELGMTTVNVTVRSDNESSAVLASSDYVVPISQSYINQLNEAFEIKRSLESEDYYENLLDVENSDNDKRIIGSMIDYGKAEVIDDKFQILVVRNKH